MHGSYCGKHRKKGSPWHLALTCRIRIPVVPPQAAHFFRLNPNQNLSSPAPLRRSLPCRWRWPPSAIWRAVATHSAFPCHSPFLEAARHSPPGGPAGRCGRAAAAGAEGAGELPRGVRDRGPHDRLRNRQDSALRERLRGDHNGRHARPHYSRRRQVLRARPGLPSTNRMDPSLTYLMTQTFMLH
jgi:hypothetical protein